jgi:hypothetical protein
MNVVVANEEVVIGWSDVDAPVPDRLSILRMDCHERAGTGDDCGEDSNAITWDVNCDKNRSGQIGRKAGNKFPNCIGSASGRTDDDYVASRHSGMDAGRNGFTVRAQLSF